MNSVSADAMIEPPRQLSQPVGSDDVMCSANAPVTGESEPSARFGRSSRPSSSMNLAPWLPSSPGWNMNSTRPAMSARCALQQLGRADQHRGVRVVAAGVHRAFAARGEIDARVLRQRQRIHVAAEQHRRARLAAIEQRGDTAGGLVQRHVEGQPVERFEHVLASDRQVVADLRPLVQRAAQRDHVAQQIVGSIAQGVEFHVRMVDLRRMTEELVDIVDDDDNVIAVVTRSEMRARRLQHRSVGDRRDLHRRPPPDPSPQRHQGHLAGMVGHRRRWRRRLRRVVRGRGRSVSSPRSSGSSTPPIEYLGLPTTSTTISRRCAAGIGVVHDGPFTFADGEVAEARWVTFAELDAMLRDASLPPRQHHPAAAVDNAGLSRRAAYFAPNSSRSRVA